MSDLDIPFGPGEWKGRGGKGGGWGGGGGDALILQELLELGRDCQFVEADLDYGVGEGGEKLQVCGVCVCVRVCVRVCVCMCVCGQGVCCVMRGCIVS